MSKANRQPRKNPKRRAQYKKTDSALAHTIDVGSAIFSKVSSAGHELANQLVKRGEPTWKSKKKNLLLTDAKIVSNGSLQNDNNSLTTQGNNTAKTAVISQRAGIMMLTQKEKVEISLSNKRLLLFRINEEGYAETFEASTDEDKAYIKQFEKYDENGLNVELKRLEKLLYSYRP